MKAIWEKIEARTKRKKVSLKVSKEQRIVFYPLRGLYSVPGGIKIEHVTHRIFHLSTDGTTCTAFQVQDSKASTSIIHHCCTVTTLIYVLISFQIEKKPCLLPYTMLLYAWKRLDRSRIFFQRNGILLL